MPGYAWPSYAAYPNYAAVTYPKQYSPTAWPYIGPFYPYPQVPLGWRKVTLGMGRRLVVPRLQGFTLIVCARIDSKFRKTILRSPGVAAPGLFCCGTLHRHSVGNILLAPDELAFSAEPEKSASSAQLYSITTALTVSCAVGFDSRSFGMSRRSTWLAFGIVGRRHAYQHRLLLDCHARSQLGLPVDSDSGESVRSEGTRRSILGNRALSNACRFSARSPPAGRSKPSIRPATTK